MEGVVSEEVALNETQIVETRSSGVIQRADQASLEISRIVFKHKYSSTFSILYRQPTLENVKDVAVRIEGKKDEVATLLAGWRHAFSESERLHWSQPDTQEADYWDQKSMDYYYPLDELLWYGVGSYGLKQNQELTEEDRTKLTEGGYGLVRRLVNDPNFEGREDLVEFLKYDLWLSWRYVALSHGVDNQPNPEFVRGFERKKELLTPLLYDAARVAAAEGNTVQVRAVFEGFDNVGAEAEADRLVLMEGLSDEERLRITIEYINTFGFIRAVDSVASKVKAEDTPEELRAQLKRLYGRIEGEETREIAAALSEIYKKIDFSKYHINEDELTIKEIALVEESISGSVAIREGKAASNVRILDIGAGTGRHALSLRRHGYQDVTAFEYEQKHVDFMRQQDPELKIIKGDWSRLYELVHAQPGGAEAVDVAYCLGRSITHNRTPSDMFHLFDEVQRTVASDGRFLFDMADLDFGVYQERVNHFRRNLEALGVEPMQSGIIFDGPNDVDRFNRMILRPDQVKATADLLGYRLIENRHEVIGGGDIKNAYYLLEKDKNWDPSNITSQELKENLRTLGLLDPGTDYNMYIEAWGMTLGQALVYVYQFGLGNEYIRFLNEQDRGPDVLVEFDGTRINLEARGMNEWDYIIATAARGMSRDEVERLLEDVRERRISMRDLELKVSTM